MQANENLSKQIAELESEKQKTVKEFADELIQDYNNNGFNDSYWYIDRVDSLLKEKGIE